MYKKTKKNKDKTNQNKRIKAGTTWTFIKCDTVLLKTIIYVASKLFLDWLCLFVVVYFLFLLFCFLNLCYHKTYIWFVLFLVCFICCWVFFCFFCCCCLFVFCCCLFVFCCCLFVFWQTEFHYVGAVEHSITRYCGIDDNHVS